jgi:hypothetical protein
VLSQNKENLSLGFDVENEVSSRSNYYRSWAQENIFSHTDIGGQNLLSAIERGEVGGLARLFVSNILSSPILTLPLPCKPPSTGK